MMAMTMVMVMMVMMMMMMNSSEDDDGDDGDGDDDGGGGAGGGVLTLNHNDENQESLHYARGCYRTLKNYLRDVHTTLEYNAHDHLANIDNPLLLNIQAYTADQRLNPFKAGFNPRSCLNPPHKGHHRRRYPA